MGKRYSIRKLRSLTCQNCGTYFTSRQNAKFCSNACKQADYRWRKAIRKEAKAAQIGLPWDVDADGNPMSYDAGDPITWQ